MLHSFDCYLLFFELLLASFTMKNANEKKEPAFDEVLKELASIVTQLESSDISLEDSLKAFEKGVMLSRTGQKILDNAETKIKVLLDDDRLENLEKEDA